MHKLKTTAERFRQYPYSPMRQRPFLQAAPRANVETDTKPRQTTHAIDPSADDRLTTPIGEKCGLTPTNSTSKCSPKRNCSPSSRAATLLPTVRSEAVHGSPNWPLDFLKNNVRILFGTRSKLAREVFMSPGRAFSPPLRISSIQFPASTAVPETVADALPLPPLAKGRVRVGSVTRNRPLNWEPL